MLKVSDSEAAARLWHITSIKIFARFALPLFCLSAILTMASYVVKAQGPVNGGFAGTITDSVTGAPIAGAVVEFINQANGFQTEKVSDAGGKFYRDSLPPGIYTIRVTFQGYEPHEQVQELLATRSNSIIPVPVSLRKQAVAVVTPTPTPNPNASPTPSPSPIIPSPTEPITDFGVLNPRRDGAFNERAVNTLPLGGTTLTRTFDELALLVPGVAPPPQAIGNSVGPGVGPGVGTSGQFSVNGLRSRANNFTVDGSDNNDEDIGVRRQGFFSLVPQPIESIQEFQIITLLAPAQYGRNLGAQVNALSKGGGNRLSGTLFGFFNSDSFNARNFFDNASGNNSSLLQGRRLDGTFVPVIIDGQQKRVFNEAGEKDSFTLLQGGFAVGGPIVKNKLFFFTSGEGQLLNAVKESHFAVPTIEQRGLFGTGAQGLCVFTGTTCTTQVTPTSHTGDLIFSLFPFPNEPTGIYGRNTYTQSLSADARGRIFSGKVDYNFLQNTSKPQAFTARYNYTDDKRDLPEVGGALFSAIRPLVRTDNFSSFLSGGLTATLSNEFRFSFGRTRLRFEQIPDATGFLQPINTRFNNPAESQFLLNARVFENFTRPLTPILGCTANTVCFFSGGTTENSELGLIGQAIISGFSPVGVDVFNFPQERVNKTFQIADNVRWQIENHSLTFGADIRRTQLASNLPRNSRPLVTFNGSIDLSPPSQNPTLFAQPTTLAAAGAATGFFQSLVLPGQDARIDLRYNQLNFFAQDEWRTNRRFQLSFGLRYEYNTTPVEADQKIENTFGQTISSNPALSAALGGLNRFIDGRTRIFNPDKNNFAPRIGLAAQLAPGTVLRGGFGVYHDQILGAVVSQSRNVFPTFTTVNFGGGIGARSCINPATGASVPCTTPGALRVMDFGLLNPAQVCIRLVQSGPCMPIIQSNTLNSIDPVFVSGSGPSVNFLNTIYSFFPQVFGTPYGATLPTRELDTPVSRQYSIGIEQEILRNTFVSASYVGTSGRNLLRFTTPNGGSNYVAEIRNYVASGCPPAQPNCIQTPVVQGRTFDPNRPVPNIGSISQFETTGRSQYHSLQIELRGRLNPNFQYQTSYVYGEVKDDVSDVFDLAGAPALPQNSLTFEGEYAPANFDVRHRFTYSFVYDLPEFRDRSAAFRALFGGWQIASTGRFNTGQPFTVNSIFDINQDGNLTDRLNNTQLITETGNRRQPLSLTSGNLTAMLAAFGRDGAVPRNSFRAGSILELDLSFNKRFFITETQNILFRIDLFNFINRANFGIPVRFLEAPSFGQATDTVTPGRRIQFALKYQF